MIIIIILFYVSLVTIVVMVGWKLISLREMKVGLFEGIEQEIHGKFYEFMHRIWTAFRVNVWMRIRRVFLLAIAHESLYFAGVLGKKIKKRHQKWFDMVEGKGVIKKKGAVSFFLQDVGEYKKSLGR
jgi:hypothetical protein